MSLKKNLNLSLLFIASFCNINIQALGGWSKYEFEKVENSKGPLLLTNLKSSRHDESSYKLNGPVSFLADFDNSWELELILSISKDKKTFTKLPYSIPKDDLCKIVNGIITKVGIIKDLAKVSGLPPPPQGKEGVCGHYKKGNYSINDLIIKKDVIPKILNPGYYKGSAVFYKKDSDVTDELALYIILE